MVNTQLSPGDPLFYLHHTWLDRLWWLWQAEDPSERLSEVKGPNIPPPLEVGPDGMLHPPPGFGPPIGCLAEMFPGINGTFPLNGTLQTPNGTLPFNGSNPFAGTSPGSNGSFPRISYPSLHPNTAITHYFNDGSNVTTLNYTLWSGGIFPNMTIRDVMDINSPFVCVEYL